MQKSKFLVAGMLSIFAACNNPGDKISDTSDTSDTIPVSSGSTAVYDTTLTGCYSAISNRDTSALQIDTKGAVVAGPLSYNLFEKDRNVGTFQGEVRGDILTGWYLFQSEGVMSVREVAWKISGAKLWPGTGEVVQRGDTTRFKDISQLRFDSTGAFVKIPCSL